MKSTKLQSKWAAGTKLLLALPFLSLLAVAMPTAHADDHYGRLHREIRQDERRGDYGQARRDRRELRHREGYRYDRGYYHDGRYYRSRRPYYRNGRRSYEYIGIVPGGISVNIGR